MKHAIGGWSFIWDRHRNKGHQAMESCKHKRFRVIPKLLIRKARADLRNCRRLGKEYLRWYDWPLVSILLFMVLVPKLVGMTDALRNVKSIPNTAYR